MDCVTIWLINSPEPSLIRTAGGEGRSGTNHGNYRITTASLYPLTLSTEYIQRISSKACLVLMGGCLGLVYGFLLPSFFSPLVGRKNQRQQKSKPCRKYSEGKQLVFVKNQFRKSSFFQKGNVSCGKFTQARHTYKLAGTPYTSNWKLETLVLVGGNVEKKEKINI